MVVDHPLLRIEEDATQSEILEFQRSMFVNLLIRHLELGYLTGELSDSAIAAHAALLFRRVGMPGLWVDYRYLFEIEARGNRRKQRFFAILDHQFNLATEASTAGRKPPTGHTGR